MGDDLSYAMFHQGQARDLSQQHKLQQVFLTFVGSELAAEHYERSLQLAASQEHAPGLRRFDPTQTSTHHRFVTKAMKKMKADQRGSGNESPF